MKFKYLFASAILMAPLLAVGATRSLEKNFNNCKSVKPVLDAIGRGGDKTEWAYEHFSDIKRQIRIAKRALDQAKTSCIGMKNGMQGTQLDQFNNDMKKYHDLKAAVGKRKEQFLKKSKKENENGILPKTIDQVVGLRNYFLRIMKKEAPNKKAEADLYLKAEQAKMCIDHGLNPAGRIIEKMWAELNASEATGIDSCSKNLTKTPPAEKEEPLPPCSPFLPKDVPCYKPVSSCDAGDADCVER